MKSPINGEYGMPSAVMVAAGVLILWGSAGTDMKSEKKTIFLNYAAPYPPNNSSTISGNLQVIGLNESY